MRRWDNHPILPFIPSDLRHPSVPEFQQHPYPDQEIAGSELDIQHSDTLGRILMEGSQGLCRGWFVHAPFQENIHALGITDARGKKENGLLRNPLGDFLRVYQHKGQWFALRRLEDC